MHKITDLLLKEKIIYKMNEAYNGVIFPPLINVTLHPLPSGLLFVPKQLKGTF